MEVLNLSKHRKPDEWPCPHGCKDHTVPSEVPTACGHYHSPSEWGHHEQIHNSAYWKAIGEQADKSHESKIGLRAESEE